MSKHQRHTTMMNDGREGIFFPDGCGQFGPAFRWAIRTNGDPNALAATVRSAIAQQDPRLLVTEMRSWSSYVDEAIAPTRFALILIAVFAGVAAILAMIGLYGVLATTVRQRRTEIGVRMAFGATQGSILRLVIGQGLRLSGVGIVLGVVAAVALTRVMASLLVGVTATDPATYITMAVLFAVVAMFAAWIPARGGSESECGAPRRMTCRAETETSENTEKYGDHGGTLDLRRALRDRRTLRVLRTPPCPRLDQ